MDMLAIWDTVMISLLPTQYVPHTFRLILSAHLLFLVFSACNITASVQDNQKTNTRSTNTGLDTSTRRLTHTKNTSGMDVNPNLFLKGQTQSCFLSWKEIDPPDPSLAFWRTTFLDNSALKRCACH